MSLLLLFEGSVEEGSLSEEPPAVPDPLTLVPGRISERLYESIEPMLETDESKSAGLKLCRAIERMVLFMYEIVRDREDRPGWSVLVDPNFTPNDALPWLAQFVGVTDTSVRPDILRELVKARVGQQRGTVAAMRAAAQQYLTGSRQLTFIERDLSPYRLTVLSLESETPDPSAVLRALMSQKPAGILLTFNDRAGLTWQLVRDNFATWQALKDAYATWQDVRENNPI